MINDKIKALIETQGYMILDGAMATELERMGCDLNDDLWSAKVLATTPAYIERVHRDYLEAGADCIITASYQATFEGFSKKGYTKAEAKVFMKDAITLAQKVRDDFWEIPSNRVNRQKPLVAASVGPYGAYLADGSEYKGHYAIDIPELVTFHSERLEAFIEAKPDVLAIETIPCLDEAKAVVQVLERFPDMTAWITFSAKNADQTCGDDDVAECAAYLNECPQIVALGINCTAPEHVTSLIERMRSKTQKPIIVYPNTGEVYEPRTKTWFTLTETPSFEAYAQSWWDSGAHIVGGCCRTTPADIARVRAQKANR